MKKGLFVVICLCIFIEAVKGNEEGIQGSDTIEIALQGESIAHYVAPEGFRIQLKDAISGVRMDDAGKLSVYPEAREQSITLIAYNGEVQVEYEVALIYSWTKQMEGAQQYQIPDVDQTRTITYMDTLDAHIPMNAIRGCIIAIALLVFFRYVFIRRKS